MKPTTMRQRCAIALAALVLLAGSVQDALAQAAYSSSTALATARVIKATPGRLWSFTVSADGTLSGAAWWVMIFDAVAAPGDGAVTPAKCFALASGTTSLTIAYHAPIIMRTGIVVAVSSAGCFSKTSSTHAFISGDAE